MGSSLPWPLLLLGFFLGRGTSREDRTPLAVVGILGGSVTLPLQLRPGQQVESVSWRSRSAAKTIAKVTLGAAGRPEREEIEARYQGRVRVVGPGSSLQISHLSQEDAGSYRAHVYLRDSPETHTWEYLLQVYELVSQPHVKMSSGVGENGSCTTILTCVAEGRGDSVTYSWTPLGPRTVVSHKGSVLSVSSRPEDGTRIFTCVVKNAVSNSSSLPVWVLPSCTGPGILGGEAVGEIVTGILGESATLTLEVPVGEEVESVTWSSRGLLAVLQPREAGEPILVAGTQGPYKGRLSTPRHGYSLQISPLRLQDSGPYRARITLRNPPRNISKDLTLRVYERLQEPNITARSLITEDGTCSLTLTCSLQQAGEDVQYLWDPHSPGTVVSHGGTTLTVSWKAGSSDSLRCTTRNPVSHSSSSILARPLCSASFLTCSSKKGFLLLLILGALGI